MMSRTNDLRQFITAQLLTVANNVYYENAIEGAGFPHVVFTLDKVNLGDLNREDYTLDIDVWDRGTSALRIEQLCDEIEDLFDAKNNPQNTILPTFFKDTRNVVADADRTLKHRNLKFIVQNYKKEA